jgi:uncharacterized membrane protein
MRGHPLHPALVHFPLALLLTATLADLAGLAGVWSDPQFAARLMAAGLAAGLLAMIAGMLDLRRLDEPLMDRAMRHVGAVAVGWLGYGVALYLRRDSLAGEAAVPAASHALSLLGACALVFGGWLGGELVYRYGAGRVTGERPANRP